METFIVKHTKGTGNGIFFDALKIREEVFIKEQLVPVDIEMDNQDEDKIHFVCYSEQAEPIGTARLMKEKENVFKLQRMAVLKTFRHTSAGSEILAEMEEYIKNSVKEFARQNEGKDLNKKSEQKSQKSNSVAVVLRCHAQIRAKGFYEKKGFQSSGSAFVEAGIEHIEMRKPLNV